MVLRALNFECGDLSPFFNLPKRRAVSPASTLNLARVLPGSGDFVNVVPSRDLLILPEIVRHGRPSAFLNDGKAEARPRLFG